MSKRRYLTSTRLRVIWGHSESCYSDAVKEYGFSSDEIRAMYSLDTISWQELKLRLEELDEIYRGKLCDLPTDIVEDIVNASLKGKQLRQRKTLDTLISELVERQLINEEDRSS